MGNWMDQRNMLSSFNGEFVDGVVVDHLGNTLKWLTELTKNETTFLLGDPHVHKSFRAPKMQRDYCSTNVTNHMIIEVQNSFRCYFTESE